jgi:hypothetical protein
LPLLQITNKISAARPHCLLPVLDLRIRGSKLASGPRPTHLWMDRPARILYCWLHTSTVLVKRLSALTIESQCSTDLATVPLMTLSVRGFAARCAAFPSPPRGAVVYNGALSLDRLILLHLVLFFFPSETFSDLPRLRLTTQDISPGYKGVQSSMAK